MKFVFTLVLLLSYAVSLVSPCNQKKIKPDFDLPRKYDGNPNGWYSWLNIGNRVCDISFEEISQQYHNTKNSMTTKQDNKCNFPVGARLIEFGYINNLVETTASQPFMKLTCDNIINVSIRNKSYHVPINTIITPVEIKTQGTSVFQKEELAARFLEAKGINYNLDAHYKLLTSLLKREDRAIKVGVLVEHMEYIYLDINFINFTEIQPTKSMLFDYRSLPDDLEENWLQFFSFIYDYDAGGKQSEIGNRTGFIISGGNSKTPNDEWVHSIIESPTLLYSSTNPMWDIIDKNQDRNKHLSLKKMAFYIDNRRKAQQALMTFEMLKTHHLLANFLRTSLQEEILNLCPNQKVIDSIEDYILKPRNFNLKRFSITCTHDRWFHPAWDQEIIITREFSLIPHVCFTKIVNFATCVHASMKVPTEIKCVAFYSENNCTGSLLSKVSPQEDTQTLAIGMINSKSFSFCEKE